MMHRIIFLAVLAIVPALRAQTPRPSPRSLRASLCGTHNPTRSIAPDAIFYYEDQLRPAIRTLLRDQNCFAAASESLSLIGVPEDLRTILRSRRPLSAVTVPRNWAYRVACAMLTPASDLEWQFLRMSALNEFHDGWADAGAIQTLKLIASTQSLTILEEVQRKSPTRTASASRAVAYVQSKPPAFAGDQLAELAERVAEVIRIGDWRRNQNTRYNRQRDKALVDIVYEAGDDVLIFTATFHKVDGLWRLRGVRETLQALVMKLSQPCTLLPDELMPPEIPTNSTPIPTSTENLIRSLSQPKSPDEPGRPAQKK